jgi:hypothetical protein
MSIELRPVFRAFSRLVPFSGLVEAWRSGIHPLVLLCDALPLVFVGKGKRAFLRVPVAITWHEKELRESQGQSGSVAATGVVRLSRCPVRFEDPAALAAQAGRFDTSG